MIHGTIFLYLLCMNTEEILSKLRQVRKEKGVSQDEIAKEIGVSRHTYLAMENGKQEFSLQRLEKVIKFLDINIFDLVEKNDDRSEKISQEINEIQRKLDELKKGLHL
jgi:putative transcriptional regulator